ncbi:MAG: hypothetical protein J6N76_02105, partial [Lachnospiraceae bacterium]|nr:hypothetical protein [Lachnospiraceae bacterium]
MKENNEELYEEREKHDNSIISLNDSNNLIINEEENKKSFKEQDKRLKDKKAADAFEEKQKKKQKEDIKDKDKKTANKVKETAAEKNARLEQTLDTARRYVLSQMSSKMGKKDHKRAYIRSHMLVNNKDFWDELYKDAENLHSDPEETKAERELVERELIGAKLQHKV